MSWLVLLGIGVVGGIVWGIVAQSGGWKISPNGNQTRIYKGSRITIFESDGGWKYCIADPDDRDPPYFSDPYPTQDAAIHEAMALMDGEEPTHQTKREIREAEAVTASIVSADNASSFCADVYNEVSKLHQSGAFTLGKIRPLKKAILREIEALKSSYQHFYSDGQQARADDIWAIRKKLQHLDEHLADLIAWLQSGKKSERGSPPDLVLPEQQ